MRVDPSVRWEPATGAGRRGLRNVEVPGEDARAESVGQGQRRLGQEPGLEGDLEDAGRHALGDQPGHRGVEVLVEVRADLGEPPVPDAEQVQLLPEQPLLPPLLVTGQAPVQEGPQPLGRPLAGVRHGALAELLRHAVRVAQHLAEEELLGVEVVVEQAGRHPRGLRDRGHPHLGETVADDHVGGRGQDLAPRLRGGLLSLGHRTHFLPDYLVSQ
jgi:hypothetical protein